MTRSEAAKICQSIKFMMDKDDYSEEVEEALDMAMEALVQEETSQNLTKPNKSDLISRQAAIDTVMGFMPSLTTPDGCGQFDREIFEAQEMFVDIGQALNKLPSAQPFTTGQIQTMQELEFAQVEKAYELGTKEKIIRCMDCKYLQKWRSEESAKKFGQTYECARNVLDCPTLEDFCSHAERRTDE